MGSPKKCFCLFVTSKTAYSMRTQSPLFFLLQPKVAIERRSRKIQAKSPKIRAQFANYLHVNDVSNVRAGHIKWQGHHQILYTCNRDIYTITLNSSMPLLKYKVLKDSRPKPQPVLHLAHCGGIGRVFTNEGTSSPSDPSCTGVPL